MHVRGVELSGGEVIVREKGLLSKLKVFFEKPKVARKFTSYFTETEKMDKHFAELLIKTAEKKVSEPTWFIPADTTKGLRVAIGQKPAVWKIPIKYQIKKGKLGTSWLEYTAEISYPTTRKAAYVVSRKFKGVSFIGEVDVEFYVKWAKKQHLQKMKELFGVNFEHLGGLPPQEIVKLPEKTKVPIKIPFFIQEVTPKTPKLVHPTIKFFKGLTAQPTLIKTQKPKRIQQIQPSTLEIKRLKRLENIQPFEIEESKEISVPIPKIRTKQIAEIKIKEMEQLKVAPKLEVPTIQISEPSIPKITRPKPKPKRKKKIEEPFGYWYPKEWKELINVEKAIKNLEALFK